MVPFQQGENVVDHLTESHVPGRKTDNVTACEGHSATRDSSTYPAAVPGSQEGMCLTRGRLF